jgi:hypothetical protein
MPLCNGTDTGCVNPIDNIAGRESGLTSFRCFTRERCVVAVLGPSSEKRVMTRGSQAKFGCATPVAHPSSDTLKSRVTRTPTTPPMKSTSNTRRNPYAGNVSGHSYASLSLA